MKKIILVLIVLIIAAGIAVLLFLAPEKNEIPQNGGSKSISIKIEEPTGEIPSGQKEQIMQITSKAFNNHQTLPSKYTCDDEGVNPPLDIQSVPLGTKSLAIVVDDPDSPGGVFTHWLMWNIDPSVSEITENFIPTSGSVVLGKTSAGNNAYVPPCPPTGEHSYRFKVYALDTNLDLDARSDQKFMEDNMIGHILAKAEIVAVYGRK